MCLILLAHRSHPRYPLIVAANRDEYFARPAASARFWDEAPQVLAGRDLQAGGTWLGMTRTGRFAALTNYRDPPSHRPAAPSRGALVGDYLLGDAPPRSYLESIAARGGEFNGFNLLVAEGRDVWAYCNRSDGMAELVPGLHGVSNGLFDEPWPKVERGRTALAELLKRGEPQPESLLDLLADRVPAPDDDLPQTGIGIEWERLLSPRFINAPGYGTRCSTVVLVRADGQVTFVERTFDSAGLARETVEYRFELDGA